jgi:hypothetical protein
MLCPLFEHVTDDERQYAFFSKDSTAIYTAWASMNALKKYLGTKLLAKDLWPECSPSINYYFILFTGYHKMNSLQVIKLKY